VRSLAARGPIAVVSGALRDEIELGLEVLGVRALVGHIVAAEDTRAGKPDPEGYLLGVEWLRATAGVDAPRHTLVVEDSLSGIEAAKAAQLTCLAVAHSYSRAELAEARPDEIVDTVSNIDGALVEALYRRTHEQR
jgi:beta-phosphoglucomutase-like phosphatase (HAD superfamily)